MVNHIRDLLYHHDCVVVPGFGGFVTNERPARIDRVSGSFYPPAREVGFNARIDHNDGLLISHVSARLSMNYVDAKNLVESFVEKVKSRLVAGRPVPFEGIGQFVVDRNHNLQFEPDPLANFLSDSYGLSFFRYPELYSQRPAAGFRSIDGEESSPVYKSLRKMLRYAAIGIPLIAALTWGAMNTGVVREFNFDLSSLNPFQAVVDSEPVQYAGHEEARGATEYSAAAAEDAEWITGSNSAVGHEAAGADAADIAGPRQPDAARWPEAQNQSAESHVRRHHVVAGSFTRKANALTLSRQLEGEGYTASIIESENGMYRVSMFASGNPAEALRMLRRVRSGQGNSDIWMLSI